MFSDNTFCSFYNMLLYKSEKETLKKHWNDIVVAFAKTPYTVMIKCCPLRLWICFLMGWNKFLKLVIKKRKEKNKKIKNNLKKEGKKKSKGLERYQCIQYVRNGCCVKNRKARHIWNTLSRHILKQIIFICKTLTSYLVIRLSDIKDVQHAFCIC